MNKQLFFCLFAISALAAKAQITNSLSVPYDDIREYDGSYEQIGSGHFFYPNEHETRLNNESNSTAIEQVQFYTVNTYPKKYLLRNNNVSFNYVRRDTIAGTVTDSLHRVDVEMYNSSPAAFLARVDTQNTAVLSYFDQWYGATGRTDVRGGATIACQSVWRNIDLVYTSNNQGLKMYFIVYPGGNPDDVVLHIKGSRANGISGANLNFYSNWGGSAFIKPRMYQYTILGSVVTPVNVCPASWQSLGSDNYGITTTSSYITSLPLIIEVMEGVASTAALTGVSWSTYIGGSIEDKVFKSKSDNSNNLFIGGSTSSPNFPVNAGPMVSVAFGTPPSASARTSGFIGKFNPNGVLQWVTYVGGSLEDQINDFDFNGGDIYAVGYTKSADMPVFQKTGATTQTTYGGAGDNDGFVFQLSSNGQTNNWLTYFGGNRGDDFNACKFDGSGNFFVIGRSNSTNLSPVFAAGSYTQNYISTPALPTSYDAIIAKFDNTSTLNWFTFYGTNGTTAADDVLFGIDIDGTDVYVCGQANTGSLPGSINSGSGGILTKFSTGGTLASARWTNNNLWNYAVRVNNNKVYTCGYSFLGMSFLNSGNYYFNNAASAGQACFGVYDAGLSNIHFTNFGGSPDEDFAVDIQFAANGVFYISGRTNSSNFPINTPSGMFSSGLTGSFNYFVAAFKENHTNILWSTEIGSQNFDGVGDGLLHCASIALDGQGFLHLCGSTNSSNTYPLSTNSNNPYYQTTNSSAYPLLNNGTITRFDLTPLSTVGIKDFANTSFPFGFYPNPTAKELIIDNKELMNQNLHFAVYDLQGKKLNEGSMNTSEQNKIDVSRLANGMYIINVSNGERTFSNKFVKSGE